MTNKDKIKEVEDYFASDAISQSKLKTLLLSPQLFNKEVKNDLYFEEKEHFIIGSAVDFLFTFNGDMDFFNEYYYVSHIENKPTDVVKSIIHSVFNKVINECAEFNIEPNFKEYSFITGYKDTILNACNEHGYYNNWKDDTRINKICEEANDQYFQELVLSKGKTILSKEDLKTIISVYKSIIENEYTREYFNAEKYEILNQVAIYFDIDGIKCKALLDRVCIDHEAKTIQIIDFKTIGDYTLNFHRQAKKFRYDVQAAFYQHAFINSMFEFNKYENYKVLPFVFIVESTLQQGFPIIYKMSHSLLNIGRNGQKQLNVYDSFHNKAMQCYEILGYSQLFNLLKYYEENGYDTPKIIKENNNCLTLDWFGIV